MRTFVKDYKELCKVTERFYKNHWKGVIVMSLISGAATMAYVNKDNIKNKVKETFSKED